MLLPMPNGLTSTDCLDLVGILDAAQTLTERLQTLGPYPDKQRDLTRYMDLRERLLIEAKGKS